GTSDRGLLRRNDATTQWTALTIDRTTAHDVRALAADDRAPGTLYVGTGRGRLFKTTDAGATWRDCPLTGVDERTPVLAVAIDPTDPNRLWAGTGRGGLLATADAGASWTRVEAAAAAIALSDVVALAI